MRATLGQMRADSLGREALLSCPVLAWPACGWARLRLCLAAAAAASAALITA